MKIIPKKLKSKNSNVNQQMIFPSFELKNWKKKKFSDPSRVIHIATLFSGIGAIEQALKRLKLKHKIIFAGDIDKNLPTKPEWLKNLCSSQATKVQ